MVASTECCSSGTGLVHSRPEFIYFWFYFVIVNGVWIVVPAIVLTKAAMRISAAVQQTSTRYDCSSFFTLGQYIGNSQLRSK